MAKCLCLTEIISSLGRVDGDMNFISMSRVLKSLMLCVQKRVSIELRS